MANNLLQLGMQLREIWKQLGLNQKVSVVAAALLVLGGLLSLAFWSNRADYALLYGRLEDGEAAKVITALDEAKVPYKTGGGGGSIYIPSDKVHTMRMQLAGRGIPRGDGVGFEIFDKPNFGLSDFVQRANYLRAVQGELARTIGQLNEVEAARVMIVMPENRLLSDSQRHPTASVFVRVKGSGQLDSQSIASIRFLVANAVEGLEPNHVSVVDNRGRVLSANTESDSLVGLSADQLALRQKHEQYLSRKAEDMLQMVLGPGQAVVRVSADINFDTKNTTTEIYDPEAQVPRNTTIEDDNTDSTTSSGGGAAGIAANTSVETNNAASGGPQTLSKTKKKTTTTTFDNSKTVSTIQKTPGDIKRLSAAVFVAAKMEGTGADRKAVPRTEDELKKLRAIVQSALGLQLTNDTSRLDEITLEEIPFNDTVNTELTKQLDQQQRHVMVLDLVGNLIYPALALGILFYFYRTYKRTPLENIPIGIPLGSLSGNGHSRKNGNGHGMPDWSKPAEPGVVTVEVLNRLVKDNPENMSQAIRTWLTRSTKPTLPKN